MSEHTEWKVRITHHNGFTEEWNTTSEKRALDWVARYRDRMAKVEIGSRVIVLQAGEWVWHEPPEEQLT